MTRRGWLLFASMCAIWGIPYLLIRVAVRDLSPAMLVLARTGIGAMLLLPLAAARGEVAPVLRRWRGVLVFSAVEIALPWWLLSDAEVRLSSSLTGLLIAAVPLVGALIVRERMGLASAVGLGLGIVGVGALVGLDVGGANARSLAEIAVVVVCYAVGPIVLARSLSDLPSLGVIAVALGAAAVVYIPIGAASAPSELPSGKVLASVVGLAVVCTAVAFLLFVALIAEIGPVRATVITYVNPAVAALLGVAVLGESFTAGMGVGFALILAGSLLATRPGRAPVVVEAEVAR